MTGAANEIPTAVLRPQERGTWFWIIPVLALVFTGWLIFRAWSMRGLSITVQLDNGHGLKVGDDVRYRGIRVGKIDQIALAGDLQSIIVEARLTSQADLLARPGSRFWVVRPEIRLTQIAGLETLIGPRFLAVVPGEGLGTENANPNTSNPQSRNSNPSPPTPQRHFIGLSAPPVVESILPGDLEIILQSSRRGSLHAGAPVSYRQTRIGTVLSVGLTGDGGAVEARVHIQQPYAMLIRPQTRFWDVGGFAAEMGLTGFSIEVDSAEALLHGGVALATPPPEQRLENDQAVRTGHRFVLAQKPENEWLDWEPAVAIGNSLLPAGAVAPAPLRASLGWRQNRLGGWISTGRSRAGWVIQTSEGLLGPADLLKPDEGARDETVVLEVAGQMIERGANAAAKIVWERHGLAMLDARIDGFPAYKFNSPERDLAPSSDPDSPPDCLAIGDPIAAPMPLAASRLTSIEAGWRIDPAVPIDRNWHGAAVVSRVDGGLLGLILVDDDNLARIALLQ